MSVHQDRGYYRLRYLDEDGKPKLDYFGKDKAAALRDAIVICDLKIRRWEKRKEEYLDELEGLLAKHD